MGPITCRLIAVAAVCSWFGITRADAVIQLDIQEVTGTNQYTISWTGANVTDTLYKSFDPRMTVPVTSINPGTQTQVTMTKGSAQVIYYRVGDSTAPVATITSPVNGAPITTSITPVSGTVSLAGASVFVNGVTAGVVGLRFDTSPGPTVARGCPTER